MMMYVAHDAFTRDLQRLTAVTGAARTAEPVGRTGWAILKKQLHIHHATEDLSLWPTLRHKATRRGQEGPDQWRRLVLFVPHVVGQAFTQGPRAPGKGYRIASQGLVDSVEMRVDAGVLGFHRVGYGHVSKQAGRFRRELPALCDRMLGSADDAEEVMQGTCLSEGRQCFRLRGKLAEHGVDVDRCLLGVAGPEDSADCRRSSCRGADENCAPCQDGEGAGRGLVRRTAGAAAAH
jgi:hypothetical protein